MPRMPLVWRYLLRNYLQVFSLCVVGFISILLVTRFQNIARFAATGAPKMYILKFILYQVPFVLPMATPISCLIAAILLFRKMSLSHELTSLRSFGMSLSSIAFPLLACGLFIAICNFTIVSEITPKCRGLSKGLAYQMTTINPLCFLQKEALIKLKNIYIDTKTLKSGEYAEDVCVVTRNFSTKRLGLMFAKKLSLQEQNIIGNDVTFISSIDTKNPQCFDHLLIENQGKMQTGASQITQFFHNNEWNTNYDSLNLRFLQAKHQLEKRKNSKIDVRAMQEIARRTSLGLAAFIFTFVGIVFGVETPRNQKWKGWFWAGSLMILYFITFIAAKSMKHTWLPNIFLYLAPLLCIFLITLYYLRKITRGLR